MDGCSRWGVRGARWKRMDSGSGEKSEGMDGEDGEG